MNRSYKWLVVAMLWSICFFNYADRQTIPSVFPKLKEEFGFDKQQLGLIASAFMWVYAAGAPFAGFLCDRVGRTRLILGGCFFWSLLTLLTGWCTSLTGFVVVRALEGLGETFYFPAAMSLLSDYHDRRTRSRALGFHQSSVYVGTIAGSAIGAWLAERSGWRTGFYLFGGLGMGLALLLSKTLREPARESPTESKPSVPAASVDEKSGVSVRETLRSIFASRSAPFLMLAFVGANFVATIFLTWTTTFLVEKFNFSLTTAGLRGAICIQGASALAVPLAGILADRLASRFGGGRIVVQLAGLLAGAVFIFLVATTKNVVLLFGAMAAFGFCKGFYDSGIFASLFDGIDPGARGTATGLMNTVGWTGGALGPLFVGFMAKHGSRGTELENMSDGIAAGAIGYIVCAILLGIAIIMARREARFTVQPAEA
jgi:MFS family permease